MFRNRESGQPVNVTFGVEPGGKEWATAYVYRRNQINEVIWVQNGNLRSWKDGDRETISAMSTATSAYPGECFFSGVGCYFIAQVGGPDGCINQCAGIIGICGGGGLINSPALAAGGGVACGFACTNPCLEEKGDDPDGCLQNQSDENGECF